MSVILDALKKLDRERSARRSGTANIAVEILRSDLPRSGKKIPLYAAVAFLTAVATAAVTYSVIVKVGSRPKSPSPLAVSVNPPEPRPLAEPASVSSEPSREVRDELSPTPPKTQVSAKSKRPPKFLPENKTEEKKDGEDILSKEAGVAPQQPRIPLESSPGEPATTSPRLDISAIVWYEEPSRRFAMINGSIATEGSVVEGMKVEEICPNRVRFLQNGQHFEIFIK